MEHRITVDGDKRGFQATCSCGKYRSKWQAYPGIAEQRGRMHASHQISKERKREANRGTG
jgi:hypothetical protein